MNAENTGEYTMDTFHEKVEFIAEHEAEIKPLLSSDEKRDLGDINSEAAADKFLERFETKAYRYEKPEGEFDPDAKRILISFSDPSDFGQQMPMIERLMVDKRCKGISVVTDNIAGLGFAKFVEAHPQFKQERSKDKLDNNDPQDDLVIPDIERAVEGVDIALIGIESVNSPSGMMIFNAKSTFGAKKLFISNGGWNGVGGRKELFTKTGEMDQIDGMFVNDDLAKKITETQLPEELHEHIFATGTPAIDVLEISNGPKFERAGRELLSIKDDEIALLYCGDISGEYEKMFNDYINPRINEETFSKTLNVLKQVANQKPDKKFVLLVRPHPRDGNKEELLQPQRDLPVNLRIVSAEKGIISMQEAGYASDIVLSIISTENILETLRGKEAVYLGYKDNGLGDSILKNVLGDDLPVVATHPGITVIDSDDALLKRLNGAHRNRAKEFQQSDDESSSHSSIDNILNIVFS